MEGDFNRLEKDFLKSLTRKGRSSNTLKNYRTDIACFKSYLAQKNGLSGSLDLAKFEPDHIQYYGDYLNQRYSSDNSRRRRVQSLRIFFDFLVRKKVYPQNIVRSLPSSPKFLDIPRATPRKQVIKLWSYLLTTCRSAEGPLNRVICWRNALIFLLIYGGALKVSTLSSLKRSSLKSGPRGIRVLVDPPKREPYTIPLPSITKRVLQSYKKALGQVSFQELFFNANNHRILSGGLSPRGFEIIFKEIKTELDIVLTPKSLRQSCLLKWLAGDVPETTIKEWLGVAPSYSMALYKEYLPQTPYDDDFLEEEWKNIPI